MVGFKMHTKFTMDSQHIIIYNISLFVMNFLKLKIKNYQQSSSSTLFISLLHIQNKNSAAHRQNKIKVKWYNLINHFSLTLSIQISSGYGYHYV